MTDDQGYGDISAHGNPILKTPNLDRMRERSLRFTDFHVSPTCAPTRSALMTGRHEFRNGVTHTVLERERLTPSAKTLAESLNQAGYQTGIFGKWHLGDEERYQPQRRGFDEVFIHGAGGIGQSYEGSCGDAPGNTYFDPWILHNGKFEKTSGYCTDVFFDRATDWIDSIRSHDRPFLAWIATNAPHSPYIAKEQDRDLYRSQVDSDEVAHFYGMIHNIDDRVGRLLTKLDEWGIAEKTLVIFMNDNGGTAGTQIFNAGMRGAKGTPWIGGTRASSFWHWPGKIAAGDCSRLAAHIDVLPTLMELSNAELTDELKTQIEGKSLVRLLENPNAEWRDRTLMTHVGRWPKGTSPELWKYRGCSVRTTRWHFVSIDGGAEPKWQLFDLEKDPSEMNDCAEENRAMVEDLAARYDRWWFSLQSQFVNEDAIQPPENAFKRLFQSQQLDRPK